MAPLPVIVAQQALQCRARCKRSGVRCLNLAAHGMPVCRYHGARRPETIRSGSYHPQYRHGQETDQMRQAHRESSVRLRALEDMMHLLGITKAERTPGPKPLSYRKLKGL